MSHKRLIWQEMSELAANLAQQKPLGDTDVTDLTHLLNKLGKVQYRANSLFEAQLEQQKETLGSLKATITRQEEIMATLDRSHRKEIETARHGLLLAILPVVDGLEVTLENGQQQMGRLEEGGQSRALLESWLDGVRILHRHMLDVLSRAGVEPIRSVGNAFDPHLHVAAGVDTRVNLPAGTISAEERRGYLVGDEVLRYAEVIVSRPSSKPAVAPEPDTEKTNQPVAETQHA